MEWLVNENSEFMLKIMSNVLNMNGSGVKLCGFFWLNRFIDLVVLVVVGVVVVSVGVLKCLVSVLFDSGCVCD